MWAVHCAEITLKPQTSISARVSGYTPPGKSAKPSYLLRVLMPKQLNAQIIRMRIIRVILVVVTTSKAIPVFIPNIMNWVLAQELSLSYHEKGTIISSYHKSSLVWQHVTCMNFLNPQPYCGS